MVAGDPFIFTYSSGFGALALQLKQTREDFCSNWASLDWGKREWPPIGTIGRGGVRGVRFNSSLVSDICYVNCTRCAVQGSPYCQVFLSKGVKRKRIQAAIRNRCYC